MITADTNTASPFRDNIYIAWDAASGGSSGGGVRVATSTDHGATFNPVRIDDPNGPGRSMALSPFVGPDGTVYVAWNDFAANVIAFASRRMAAQPGSGLTSSPLKMRHSISVFPRNCFAVPWFFLM